MQFSPLYDTIFFMKVEEEALLSYYKELEQINSHSDVFLVKHIESQQIFVKKILPATSESIYRTLMEIKAPGVPVIYHVINDNDTIVVIEEFINGITISEYLEQNGVFSEEDATKVLRSLCISLQNLHKSTPPIIHRDIKPSNVIIDSQFNTTLIDFDASKTFDKDKSRDTVLMGTAAYAAPEQFGYAQSDARTDIYALGVLLNVMLTNQLPVDAIYNGRLNSIITKCISIDPADRFQNVNLLISALKCHPDSLLPPGFRTKTPWKIATASICYAFIICSSCWLIVEGNPPSWWVAANRIGAFLCFISIVLFMFDYRGISSRLPFSSSSNMLIKWFGRFFWSTVAIGIIISILAIIAPY